MQELPVVDLWDWALVTGSRKDGKGDAVRLVGRLVRKSVKLHPSVPSGGGLLKTAPICEVHIDLVRVTSGLHLPLFIQQHMQSCIICQVILYRLVFI